MVVVLTFSFLSSLAAAGEFNCEIRQATTCLSNQTMLVRLNSSEGTAPNNSHAMLANASSDLYPYSVCCWTDTFRTLDNTCSGSSTTVLRLQDMNNSHVQAGNMSGYSWPACLNVTAGTIECDYPNDACAADSQGILSLSSSEPGDGNLTNAHLAEPAYYRRQVCCKIGAQTPPVVAWVDLQPINTTSSNDTVCGNGTVSDADGDTVTLHYNWFLNGTSLTVLNLPMDYDSDTGTTHDISGYGNDGTLTNGTFLPLGGKVGGGFGFDGTDDSLTVGNTAPLNQDFNELSIAFWMYADSTTTSDARLVGKGTSVYGTTYHTDGKVWFYIKDGGNAVNTAVGTGAWHHIVGTFSNESGHHVMRLYVDGALAATKDPSKYNLTGTGGTFTVGGPTSYFNGSIDEVLVFNRSLSAPEVTTLYDTNNKQLNASEFVRGDRWNCSITPVDSTGLNGSAVFSNETYVDGSLPTVPTLLSPADGNTSVFERFVNLNWTDSTDADNDPITYTLNLSVEPGSCSVQAVRTGLTASNQTEGELCVDQRYWWNVTACDNQEGCSSRSSTFNFTIASVLQVTIVDTSMDFGALANGQSVTTDDYSPQPFIVENLGNVPANITLNGSKAPFTSVGLGDTAYQFRVEDNETGSMNASGSQTTYTPIQSFYVNAIKQLNYSDSSDRVAIHINITVPINEPHGSKSGNITIQSVAS